MVDEKTKRFVNKFLNPELNKLGLEFDAETKTLMLLPNPIDYVKDFRLEDKDTINNFIETFCDKRKLAMLYKQCFAEQTKLKRQMAHIDQKVN